MKSWEDSKNRLKAIEGEAHIACTVGEWSRMFHIMALSTVSERTIFSVYPNATSTVRDILHGMVKPRTLQQEEESPLFILWTRCGNLDSRPGSWFEPDHFVPLLPEKAGAKVSKRTEVKRSIKSTLDKSGKITNLFSRVDTEQEKSKKRSPDFSKEKPCFESKKRKSTGSINTQTYDDRASKEPRVSEIKGKVKPTVNVE